MDQRYHRPQPPVSTGLRGRCPRCGTGALFDGLLNVADRCSACDLDLRNHDSGDGPAVFAILILGFVTVGLAFFAEVVFAPPLWLHALVWPPLILALAVVLLRLIKGVLVALQYRHRADEMLRSAGDGRAGASTRETRPGEG